MTKDPQEREPDFKVIDRRRFTEEGDERTLYEDRYEKEAESKKEPVNIPAGKTADERPSMSFSLFIQSLAHQSMMALGLIPWPDSGLIRKEMRLAKDTIDILLILKEKTSGNLSEEEDKLLDSMLYQLQLAYVEIANVPPEGSGSVIK